MLRSSWFVPIGLRPRSWCVDRIRVYFPSAKTIVIPRIAFTLSGYFERFPPASFNVKIEDRAVAGQATKQKAVILTHDIAAGDVIFKDFPVVAALDPDVQTAGKHCSHCFRVLSEDAINLPADEDVFTGRFCSEQCLTDNKAQSHTFLFSLDSPLPEALVPPVPITREEREKRKKAQENYVEYIRKHGHNSPLLAARFIARQLAAETQKLNVGADASQKKSNKMHGAGKDYTDTDGEEYALADHLKRLKYLEVHPNEEEMLLLVEVLQNALPGLGEFVTDEAYATMVGKMAFNAYGVSFDNGRDDRPAPQDRPEDVEKSRTPNGTARQIGSAFYTLSSYLNHSCAPTANFVFIDGTNEVSVVAAKDLKSGDEVTVAWVDVVQKEDETLSDCRRRRRIELARGWKFACGCDRCEEEAKVLEAENVEKQRQRQKELLEKQKELEEQARKEEASAAAAAAAASARAFAIPNQEAPPTPPKSPASEEAATRPEAEAEEEEASTDEQQIAQQEYVLAEESKAELVLSWFDGQQELPSNAAATEAGVEAPAPAAVPLPADEDEDEDEDETREEVTDVVEKLAEAEAEAAEVATEAIVREAHETFRSAPIAEVIAEAVREQEHAIEVAKQEGELVVEEHAVEAVVHEGEPEEEHVEEEQVAEQVEINEATEAVVDAEIATETLREEEQVEEQAKEQIEEQVEQQIEQQIEQQVEEQLVEQAVEQAVEKIEEQVVAEAVKEEEEAAEAAAQEEEQVVEAAPQKQEQIEETVVQEPNKIVETAAVAEVVAEHVKVEVPVVEAAPQEQETVVQEANKPTETAVVAEVAAVKEEVHAVEAPAPKGQTTTAAAEAAAEAAKEEVHTVEAAARGGASRGAAKRKVKRGTRQTGGHR